MTKSALLISTAVGLTVALSGSAFAAHALPGHPGKSNAPVTHGVSVDKSKKAKYRVAYFYTRGLGTSASQGVSAFSNPSTGVYCITPTKALSGAIYPNVSIEWGSSYHSALSAFYENPAYDCASGDLEVRTYDDSGNLNPDVSFDITVL